MISTAPHRPDLINPCFARGVCQALLPACAGCDAAPPRTATPKPPAPHTFALRVVGHVARVTTRYTARGVPSVELELHDTASGQTVCITHAYPDSSAISARAASHLAARLRGQRIAVDVRAVRFKAGRMLAVADLIPPTQPSPARADLDD